MRLIQIVFLLSGVIWITSLLYTPRNYETASKNPDCNRPHKNNSTIQYVHLLIVTFTVPPAILYTALYNSVIPDTEKITIFTGLITTGLLTIGLTENLKNIVGRHRPDFNHRCMPDIYGLCTGKAETLIEGKKSFPSGHSSTSFYPVFYLIYIFKVFKKKSFNHILTLAILISLSMFVCYTRVINNKHFVTDLIGGATVAFICTLFIAFVIKLNSLVNVNLVTKDIKQATL